MRALVITPGTRSGLALGEVADPVLAPDELLLAVSHSSLNFGELSAAANGEPGRVLGWDSAGVVRQAAADGSGPAVGTRVLGFGYNGGWSELRAVRTNEAAVIPDEVDIATAVALPTAAVTALRALHRSGALVGKRVLVTGASGGVGRFAVQLAALGGAHVIAASGRGAGLAELGAHEVVADLDGVGPLDVVIDNVGGAQLVRAWDLLRPGGVVQGVGWTSGEPAVFAPYSLVGPAKSISSFQVGSEFGPDMDYLLQLVAEGQLTVDIGWQGSWSRIDEAAAELLGRRVTGKAIIELV